MAESVETLGVDLRTQTKKLGAKEKARKRCEVTFSLIHENSGEKAAENGNWFRKSVERTRQMAAAAGQILLVLCGHLEHQRRAQIEGCAMEALRSITAMLPGSKWSCLLLRVVLQDALCEVTKFYPPLELRVFVVDKNTFDWEKQGRG